MQSPFRRIQPRIGKFRCDLLKTSLHPEDLKQSIVQDPDIIIDQHALIGRAALTYDAEEGEVTREIRQLSLEPEWKMPQPRFRHL